MKNHITGIGGIFFRSADPQKTREWYAQHLGLQSESWGAVFNWRDVDHPDLPGSTSWCPFKDETDYFGNSGQEFMVNYIVTDLESMLTKLETEGIKPVKAMESHEFGKFAWIDDVDGRRIELWEPAPAEAGD